jgi:hypothetical protein
MSAFPADHLEPLLIAAARARESITYKDVFDAVGLPFARWRVGALCAALEEVDALQRGHGRPELAVLVVRGSDRLPGQGWWLAKSPAQTDYTGAFTGAAAARYVAQVQARVFDYWGQE